MTYRMTITDQGATETTETVFENLAEGDLDMLRAGVKRSDYPVGNTVTVSVTAES